MKSILFNSESVRGILEDRKSQTRRVITPQPDEILQGDWAELCKYKVGDLLWVRETFNDWDGTNYRNPRYKATDENYPDVPWKPSIFMFKKYARIFLKITGIRVEILKEINEADCIAEGLDTEGACLCKEFDGVRFCIHCNKRIWDFIGEFRNLWDSINSKRGYGWDENPRVYVIEFKRIEK